ncbi:SMP-30/gluconolactonase/LRE family protein [Mycolicibacterium sp. P1-5]|uniref:SMP-30/gluconolactonase/LRE family protein n=1 Tax=Mycolicibacterium sp. P1-5 TaxID=2024617 RepID=UPI0011EC3174|nr:SMP-30/gluconolactonase/LRE family protein [Mycolicibacterium sp. P1-5]KAA0108876.1 SMP-30/gluconolactonase/LRE family protein [Mycolicibacterium sp. P1-5]
MATRVPTAALAGVISVALVLAGCSAESTSAGPAATELSYDEHNRGPVPIPPPERDLQSVSATPWFHVSDTSMILEGVTFDAAGNMYFCDVSGRRVLRLTPQRQLSTVVRLERLSPGGLAFGPDGRLFVAALGDGYHQGAVMAVNTDGSGLRPVIPTDAGYLPNDLVFGPEEGFYFSDFRGSSTNPAGGIYYASPDFSAITPILPHLAQANGVALSPDGKQLWATEFARNLLHRVELADATAVAPIGTAIAYRFNGPAPDSMRVDTDGNVYVAVYGQGRVLVFNRNGIPIGQVLLPDRAHGRNLESTSLAIRPGTRDMYIVANDGSGVQGAHIFHAMAFADGLPGRSR